MRILTTNKFSLAILLPALLLCACAQPGLQKPKAPNLPQGKNSLNALAVLANYQYQLDIYENTLREQQYEQAHTNLANQLQARQPERIREETKAASLTAEYKANESSIDAKVAELRALLERLSNNPNCQKVGEKLMCTSAKGETLWLVPQAN